MLGRQNFAQSVLILTFPVLGASCVVDEGASSRVSPRETPVAEAPSDKVIDPEVAEARLMSNIRQLTFQGRRAGEGYFSHDGMKIIFQSERDARNPFFQIFVQDLETCHSERVSPGICKTSC